MKNILVISAAALIGGCTAHAAPELSQAQRTDLDQSLAGRTAQAEVSCVNQRLLRSNRGAGEGVILFEGPTNRTLYVNRPTGGCPELSSFRALRTRTTSTQLCRGDIVTIFEPSTGIEYGSCALGNFTPYIKE
jgi:hypothetical protein